MIRAESAASDKPRFIPTHYAYTRHATWMPCIPVAWEEDTVTVIGPNYSLYTFGSSQIAGKTEIDAQRQADRAVATAKEYAFDTIRLSPLVVIVTKPGRKITQYVITAGAHGHQCTCPSYIRSVEEGLGSTCKHIAGFILKATHPNPEAEAAVVKYRTLESLRKPIRVGDR